MAALGIALVTAAAPAAADPTPTPSTTGSLLPIVVTLEDLQPLAPQPDDTLRLTGTLRNQSTTTVTGLSVQLRVSATKVGSRGQFDDYAATPDGPAPADATTPAADVVLPETELAAGSTERFALTVPVSSLALTETWQAYELAVVVGGLLVTGQQEVGRLRTFLPYAPVGVPGVGLPTRVAWIWPLVDRPHRTNDTTWTDDLLAEQLSTDGRLGGLLAAGIAAEEQHAPPPPAPRRKGRHKQQPPPPKPAPPINPVPLTWAIDPMLVDDATLMAGGYQVGTGEDRRDGSGQAAARGWLASLDRAVGGGQVLGLPYADPDVVAAVRSGLETELQAARTTGADLLEKEPLAATPLPYAWPADGLIDQRTLDTLFVGGVSAVVLDSDALPIEGGVPSETPGAHTTVPSRDAPDGGLDALLIDHTLADVVESGADDPAVSRLAVQRFVSELLMIQAELPSDQRSLVVAPHRRWDPAAGYAQALLAATGRVPWVEPVTLSSVADGPVYDKVTRGELAYPVTERAHQLSRSYLASVAAIKQDIDAFALILPPGDPQARAFDAGVLRLMSSAWRNAPSLARAERDALAHDVDTTMDKVTIASEDGSFVTLTSHSGVVPVTVRNDLDTPVQVEVRVEQDAGRHLVVEGGGTGVQTIAPHRQKPVDVHATAQTSGVFPLTVTLYTPGPNSQQYGAPVRLFVRSTAYGATALLITGGATAVLLLTVAIRLVRRARAARRTPATAG
jgi:hypothetical protein